MPRGYVRAGKNADPEYNRERARKAGQAAQSIDTLFERVVRRWAELTDEQVAHLRTLAERTLDSAERN